MNRVFGRRGEPNVDDLPGMDPYLKTRRFGTAYPLDALIVYRCRPFAARMHPRYIATVEERVYVEGPGRPIFPMFWH